VAFVLIFDDIYLVKASKELPAP